MPFYLKWWFIILMFFLTPGTGITFFIAIFLIYRRNKFKKRASLEVLFQSKSDNTTNSAHRINLADPNQATPYFEEMEEKYSNNSFDHSKIKTQKMYPDELSVPEILFLNYLDGWVLSEKDFPKYWTYDYNISIQETIQKLFSLGYIRKSDYKENMTFATIPELKEILKKNDLPISGKKENLIHRLLGTVDLDELETIFTNSRFKITPKGEQIICENQIFITNRKYYGSPIQDVLNKRNELNSRSQKFSDNDIFWSLFNEKQFLEASKREWTDYSYTHYSMCLFLARENRYLAALSHISTMLFIHLSGMNHNNSVQSFDLLFLAPAPLNELENLLEKESMSTEDFKNYFINQSFINLPFQYFSKEDMANIIVDELNGIKFNPETCKYKHNKPLKNNKNYTYYDITNL